VRLGQEGTARQYDVVGARVLAEVLLARPTRGGMASVSIRADSADCDYRTIRAFNGNDFDSSMLESAIQT
jgi:hypothetical protein